MGYVKLVKNRNYYKRFKVKFRRRRECKTDYRLRRRLITQDKRKYNAPKWRLIVRISNKEVTAQIASAKMIGDKIVCAAYSHELKRYGLKVGLTNYSACYATGLLLARRMLQKLGLDKYYKGKKSLDGNRFRSNVFNVKFAQINEKINSKNKESKEKFVPTKIYRPFRCILDTGLARCTSGARVFAIMKGAVDGGLDVPHSMNRLPGFKKGKDGAKDEYNPEKLYERIYGQHVAKYMKHLKENDPDKYNRHFSQYIREGINADDLEEMYEKVYRAIRNDPSAPPKRTRDWRKMDVRKSQPRWTKEQKEEQRLRRIQQLKQKYAPKEEKQPEDSEMVDIN